MKKKILTMVMTGMLLLGSFMMPTEVSAQQTGLTWNCELVSEDRKTALKELAAEFTEKTGVKTECAAGEADIYLGSFSELIEMYKKEKLMNLYPFMEKESPYSDQETWGAELPDEIRERIQVYKREIPGYPGARNVVKLFCNKKLFEDIGAKVPRTWSELMESARILKENGICPFVFSMKDQQSMTWQWLMNVLCNQMDSSLADSLDETEDRYVELAEACKAADKGTLDFSQPRMQEAIRFMKELYELCETAEEAEQEEEAFEVFADGKAAMVLALNEKAELLSEDFSWCAVPLPVVTKESSEYAAETKLMAGGEAELFYGVNAALTGQEEKIQTSIAFVQYMTSVEIQEKLAEKTGLLPSAKNAELPLKMKDFQIVEEPLRMSYFTGLDEQNKEEIQEYVKEYLTGDLTLAALTEKLNQSCQSAAERIREKNGWTLVNNYGMPTTGECTRCAP